MLQLHMEVVAQVEQTPVLQQLVLLAAQIPEKAAAAVLVAMLHLQVVAQAVQVLS
jgi:hypothetical protein